MGPPDPTPVNPSQAAERLDDLFRAARSAGVRGQALWDAIERMIAAGRLSRALTLIEERREDLEPVRATLKLVDILLAQGGQGRHRAALAALGEAYASGAIDLASTVDHLLRSGALALAAQLLERPDSHDSPIAGSLREEVTSAARAACRKGSLQQAPDVFADAVRALQVLSPGDETMAAHVRRAGLVLSARLRQASNARDYARATELLIRLARLAPDDLEVLDNLAASAREAGRFDREMDTLARIHAIRRDSESLRRAFAAALERSRWTILEQVIRAADEGRGRWTTSADLRATIVEIAALARVRIERSMADGDIEAALRLAAAVGDWLTPTAWPHAARLDLLAAAGRRLRATSASDPTRAARLAAAYLALAPDDLDVARLLARAQMRLRRFAEAKATLERLMEVDPHLAADWRDLASARAELGDAAGSDVSLVRAWLIEPAIDDPGRYEAAVERLAAA